MNCTICVWITHISQNYHCKESKKKSHYLNLRTQYFPHIYTKLTTIRKQIQSKSRIMRTAAPCHKHKQSETKMNYIKDYVPTNMYAFHNYYTMYYLKRSLHLMPRILKPMNFMKWKLIVVLYIVLLRCRVCWNKKITLNKLKYKFWYFI